MKQHIIKVILGMLVIGQAMFAQASDNSATIFPAEGNVQCNDYSSNSIIEKMGTTAPAISGTLTGTDNQNDADTLDESVDYTVNAGTMVGFSSSTTPIDYALLKSSKAVTVLIYPSGGVTEDANMELLVDGVPQVISSLSLCYGLGNSAPPPPPPPELSEIPACEDLTGIDGVGISCPTNGTRSVVINMELDSSFYNTDGTQIACICNDQPLVECDPDVTSDDPNSCPINDPNKSGLEVTTHFEFNNDPYFCRTTGGFRVCYPY